jgi:hypothetical protein
VVVTRGLAADLSAVALAVSTAAIGRAQVTGAIEISASDFVTGASIALPGSGLVPGLGGYGGRP